MGNALKLGLILAFLCSLAAGSLKLVYEIAQPIIDENIRIAAIKKRQLVLPGAKSFDERSLPTPNIKEGGRSFWVGKNEKEETTGFVIEVAPKGYSGLIRTTVGIGPEGAITSIAINKLDQSETPGLGSKITRSAFKDQFKGKKGDAIKLKNDGGEIDAITAATISSRAVANGVKNGFDWYMENKEVMERDE